MIIADRNELKTPVDNGRACCTTKKMSNIL